MLERFQHNRQMCCCAGFPFISQHRQSGEKLVIYGYSNGGRCALDIATALQQEKQSVDTLVTVDATDQLPKPETNI